MDAEVTVTLRRDLIRTLRDRGELRTARVALAFEMVPRERFVPPGIPVEVAYQDRALPVSHDRHGRTTSSLSQPAVIALMLEQLDARPGDRVLEVGTATGYTAALLAHLVGTDGTEDTDGAENTNGAESTNGVVTVEIDPELAATARARLAGEPAVLVRAGDGWLGAPDRAPFDRVHVTVGVDDLSPAWADQLAEGGVLVAPITLGPGLELSIAFERRGAELVGRSARPCGFVRLRGPNGSPPGPVLPDGTVLVTAPGAAVGLETVLAGRPVDEGATGPLPPGWVAGLALGQPHALTLLGPDGEGPRVGLHDPVGGGVAVIDGDRLVRYGDRGAAQLLRAHLAGAEPIRPDRLRVTARRTGAPMAAACWTVARPAFTYGIDPATDHVLN